LIFVDKTHKRVVNQLCFSEINNNIILSIRSLRVSLIDNVDSEFVAKSGVMMFVGKLIPVELGMVKSVS
jgi:hypothetical protein